MTCEQVRLNFEGHLPDVEARTVREEVAEHVSICADCSRYVEEQTALALKLRVMRESAPAVPESLDAAVVARYRQYVGREQASSSQRSRRFFPVVAWAWSGAAAAVLAIAAIWFFFPGHKVASTQVSTPTPSATIKSAPAAPRTPALPATNIAKHRLAATSRTAHPKADDRTTEAPIRVSRSLPEGFRSLMYCDSLSCPGDMEMIRVQLPASAMSRQVPGFIQASGSVTADVLVGPDGVARGIRFDEIEF